MSNDLLNDYELVYLVYNHNEKALAILYKKYEDIFRYFLYRNKIGWKDYDFLLSEGRDLIYYCIRVFNGVCPFFAFFKLCSIRLLMRYFKKKKIQEVNFENFDTHLCLKEDVTDISYKVTFKNQIQESIAEGIKNGQKLNEIANQLDINPKKVYYEFEKMKKENKNNINFDA